MAGYGETSRVGKCFDCGADKQLLYQYRTVAQVTSFTDVGSSTGGWTIGCGACAEQASRAVSALSELVKHDSGIW